MSLTAGLDVGGAHLKVALVDDGKTISAQQFACPLWKGMKHLDNALQKAQPITKQAAKFAVTMTGELSDIFPDRRTGVVTLIDKLDECLAGQVQYWSGQRGFQKTVNAKTVPGNVASMNFMATAAFVASKLDNGLLVDMGSTTTDIIPFNNNRAAPEGVTDIDRLTSGELVYTGLTRTSLTGLVDRVPFKGHWQAVTHEHFATMADVYRILGQLPDDVDLHDTADGKGKTEKDSINRLARMLGCDGIDAAIQDWERVSKYFAEQQMRRIHDGVMQVMSQGKVRSYGNVVAAGIGAKIVERLAQRAGYAVHNFADFANTSDKLRDTVNHTAPAVAVAQLLWAEIDATSSKPGSKTISKARKTNKTKHKA